MLLLFQLNITRICGKPEGKDSIGEVPCGSPHPLGLLHDKRADYWRYRGPHSLPSSFRICAFCTVFVRGLGNPRRPRHGGSRANFYLQGSTFSNLRPRQGMSSLLVGCSNGLMPSIQALAATSSYLHGTSGVNPVNIVYAALRSSCIVIYNASVPPELVAGLSDYIGVCIYVRCSGFGYVRVS